MMPSTAVDPTDVGRLLRLQVEALFHHDAAGRIVSKNKPVYAPAPRLFLGRSLGGNLWRFRDDVPDDLVTRLEPFLHREPVLERLDIVPTVQTELVAELVRHQPISELYSGPGWWAPSELPASQRAVLVTPDDVAALHPHYPTLAENLTAMSPCAAVIDDGVARSVCFSARSSPHVAEAGLFTDASVQGRGYGSDTVKMWAAAIRATGRLPIYSTSWDNHASRRVAEKLGLVQYSIGLSIY